MSKDNPMIEEKLNNILSLAKKLRYSMSYSGEDEVNKDIEEITNEVNKILKGLRNDNTQ